MLTQGVPIRVRSARSDASRRDPGFRVGAAAASFLAVALLAAVAGCREESTPVSGTTVAAASVPDERSILSAIEATEHYLASEDLASAEVVAARLAERAPDDVRARETYARVLLSRGLTEGAGVSAPGPRLQRAYEEYRAAAMLDSGGGLHQNAGSIAAMLGRHEEALAHYLAAETNDPLNPQHPLYAAQLLIRLERHDEAAEALRRVLGIDPDEPTAHASLAIVALERSEASEAREHIDRARSLAPDDLELRVLDARISRRSGDPRRGVQLLAGLDPAVRAGEPVTRELAAGYAGVGEHRRAAEAWLHRYRSRPTDPQMWRAALHAAEAFLAAGDRQEARLWLEEVRPLAPADPEVVALDQKLSM